MLRLLALAVLFRDCFLCFLQSALPVLKCRVCDAKAHWQILSVILRVLRVIFSFTVINVKLNMSLL